MRTSFALFTTLALAAGCAHEGPAPDLNITERKMMHLHDVEAFDAPAPYGEMFQSLEF